MAALDAPLRLCGKRHKNRARASSVAGEDGIVSGMAGRYATALFELALESSAVEQVQADLKAFDALVASSPDLTRLVRSPVFSRRRAGEGARRRARQGQHLGHRGNFLRVVAANRRLFAVDQIIRGFNALSPGTRAR